MTVGQKRQIFLSKLGQILGPFSDDDLQGLKRSGEYKAFSWSWSSDEPRWQAINPLEGPPPGVLAETVTEPPMKESARAPERKLDANFQAICHDNRNAISGTVSLLTDHGLLMTGEMDEGQPAPFGKGSKVWLNLLDEKTGEARNLSAKVIDVRRSSGKWSYELSCDSASLTATPKNRA